MAEGTAGIARATAEGIAEIAARHPELAAGRRRAHPAWFEDLTWGADKIAAEDERIRTTHNVNRTTEISAGWSAINDIYEAAIARIRPRSRTSRSSAATRPTATSTGRTCTSTTSTTSSTARPRRR